jgi:hypothetical protein
MAMLDCQLLAAPAVAWGSAVLLSEEMLEGGANAVRDVLA